MLLCRKILLSIMSCSKKIDIYYQNVRGLRTKTTTFYRNLCINNFNIIALTETWLLDGIYNAELFDDRYMVWRRDRSYATTHQSMGGGVLIATSKDLAVRPRPDWHSTAEDLWISITPTKSKIQFHICVLYLCAQNHGLTFSQQLDNFLSNLSNIMLNNQTDKFIILGDFNLSKIIWESIPGASYLQSRNACSSDEINLVDDLSLLNLNQFNHINNAYGKILDLVLSNDSVIVSDCLDPLVPLDPHHKALLVCVECIEFNPLESAPRIKYLYNSVNYDDFNAALLTIDWHTTFSRMTIQMATDHFYNKLYELRDIHVPVKHVRCDTFPPWYSQPLRKILKEKYKYFRKFKTYGNKSDELTFTILRARAKEIETECYNYFIKKTEESIKNNPKHFWSFMKSKSKSSSLPSCMSYNNISANNGDDICSLFSQYFHSTFLTPDGSSAHSSPFHTIVEADNSNSEISSIEINKSLIFESLSKLDISKSAGPDSIPPILLVKCATSLALPIALLFAKSIKEGSVPGIWKSAFITPVHKKGNKREVTNYRPISKLCIISKVFERIVYDQVYATFRNSFSPFQHGFLKGRSTVSNLVLLNEFITETMEGGSQVDVIYTDYSKAFDRIDHDLLLDKLHNLGIRGDLFRWFTSYISHRSQAVVLGNFTSDWMGIPSGVPQGSLLGPLLFILFVNDIDACFLNSNVLSFADDMKVYQKVSDVADAHGLQEDLLRLDEYCLRNKLDLNAMKCSCITFSRKSCKMLYNYALKGHQLQRVNEMKDLGVIMDSKLLFNKHIDDMVSKASKALGFIMRSSVDFKSAKTLKILYCTYVRSKLEYASQVWNPRYDTYTLRIERIQKKFIKYLNYRIKMKHINYHDSCKKHHFLPLAMRRTIADQVYLFKIASNLVDCPQLLSKLGIKIPSRLFRYNSILYTPLVSTNYRQNSYLWRACSKFSELSKDLNLDLFHTTIPTVKRLLNSKFSSSL